MHDDPPQQPPLPPTQPQTQLSNTKGRGARTAGGIAVAIGLLLAKAKTLLTLILSWKFLLVGAKLIWPLSTMFLSLWFYAVLFGGWKIAIVLVLMILVHELGHYTTWRNFGVQASLPRFIPGFGAFVSAPATGTPGQNVVAALAGPAFGIAAAVACWAFAWYLGESGHPDGQRFWTGCAYIGFFLNLFNLIPMPPFDGGAVAGAIDARLWIVGAVLLTLWVVLFAHTPFGIVIVLLVLLTAIPRVMAVIRGQIDPRGSGLSESQRVGTLVAYLALIGIGIAGAAATLIERHPAT